MRHGKRINNLSRTKSSRESMIISQARSLFENKRLETTRAKAKVTKQFVDELLNNLLSKEGSELERYLGMKLKTNDLNSYLMEELKPSLDADKTGGFTRIYKVENRKGDNAQMALLVLTSKSKSKSKTKDKKKD
ncbi:50S ribosomal protein L17 [Candidatus Dojkabacteria bacterium]|nr:50S ribosomal protein L17 [Candidatus Dojkabacteria bacterium]